MWPGRQDDTGRKGHDATATLLHNDLCEYLLPPLSPDLGEYAMVHAPGPTPFSFVDARSFCAL